MPSPDPLADVIAVVPHAIIAAAATALVALLARGGELRAAAVALATAVLAAAYVAVSLLHAPPAVCVTIGIAALAPVVGAGVRQAARGRAWRGRPYPGRWADRGAHLLLACCIPPLAVATSGVDLPDPVDVGVAVVLCAGLYAYAVVTLRSMHRVRRAMDAAARAWNAGDANAVERTQAEASRLLGTTTATPPPPPPGAGRG